MRCHTVTITGADDSTDIERLIAWSTAYPFVEWGILMSSAQEGGPRFPSPRWISYFAEAAREHKMKVSAHLCGRMVRDLLVGKFDPEAANEVLRYAQRVQINTHAEPHEFSYAMVANMKALPGGAEKEFIFQRDGLKPNELIGWGAQAGGVKTAFLFDTSGGAGVLPQAWPNEIGGVHCGYAGGIGPDNVLEQLARIEAVTTSGYWIDMERRVRTPDDLSLDESAVVSVLDQVDVLKRSAG